MLKEICRELEKQDFECLLIPASPEMPLDRLLVSLGFDSKTRKKMVEILSVQMDIPAEMASSGYEDSPYRLQFTTVLPFKIEDMALNQVASLVLFINRFLDLPGFELNELEGKISYRYVWMTERSHCDRLLVLSIIGGIMLNLTLFSDMIESLADGHETFDDLLSKIIKMVNEFPSDPKLEAS